MAGWWCVWTITLVFLLFNLFSCGAEQQHWFHLVRVKVAKCPRPAFLLRCSNYVVMKCWHLTRSSFAWLCGGSYGWGFFIIINPLKGKKKLFKIHKMWSIGSIAAINQLNCIGKLGNCAPLWQVRILTKTLGFSLVSVWAVLAQVCPVQVLKLFIIPLQKGRLSFMVFLSLSILTSVRWVYGWGCSHRNDSTVMV